MSKLLCFATDLTAAAYFHQLLKLDNLNGMSIVGAVVFTLLTIYVHSK